MSCRRLARVYLIAGFWLWPALAFDFVYAEDAEPQFTQPFASIELSKGLSVELRALKSGDPEDPIYAHNVFYILSRQELNATHPNGVNHEYRIVRTIEGLAPKLLSTPLQDRDSPVVLVQYQTGANQTILEFASVVRGILTFSESAVFASNMGEVMFLDNQVIEIANWMVGAADGRAEILRERYKIIEPDFRFSPITMVKQEQ